MPKRATLWVFVLAVAIVAVAGLAGEATAQVYQGPIQFNSLGIPLTITVTLNPAGAASYRITTLNGLFIDNGFLVASVNGSSVQGFVQSTRFQVRPCVFNGTYDGTVASLVLDEPSCGTGGTVTLSRVA